MYEHALHATSQSGVAQVQSLSKALRTMVPRAVWRLPLGNDQLRVRLVACHLQNQQLMFMKLTLSS